MKKRQREGSRPEYNIVVQVRSADSSPLPLHCTFLYKYKHTKKIVLCVGLFHTCSVVCCACASLRFLEKMGLCGYQSCFSLGYARRTSPILDWLFGRKKCIVVIIIIATTSTLVVGSRW